MFSQIVINKTVMRKTIIRFRISLTTASFFVQKWVVVRVSITMTSIDCEETRNQSKQVAFDPYKPTCLSGSITADQVSFTSCVGSR